METDTFQNGMYPFSDFIHVNTSECHKFLRNAC